MAITGARMRALPRLSGLVLIGLGITGAACSSAPDTSVRDVSSESGCIVSAHGHGRDERRVFVVSDRGRFTWSRKSIDADELAVEDSVQIEIDGISFVTSTATVSAGQNVHVHVVYGPHVDGVRVGDLTSDGKALTMEIDGRVAIPIPVSKDRNEIANEARNMKFVDGAPMPAVRVEPSVLEAIQHLSARCGPLGRRGGILLDNIGRANAAPPLNRRAPTGVQRL